MRLTKYPPQSAAIYAKGIIFLMLAMVNDINIYPLEIDSGFILQNRDSAK